MSSPSTSPSILIIGAGIFGTSTVYHLALTHPCPSKITIIDRSPFPPYHAASTNINKIVRADYTSRFYMDLTYEAFSTWKTWPVLQIQGGWVMLSNESSDLAKRIRKNFRERGSDVTKDVGVDEHARERWEGMLKETDLEEMEKGYWNPDAGWADAGDAVAKMIEEAMRRGVMYEIGDVEELVLSGNGVHGVRTKSDELDIHDDDRVEKQVTAAGVAVVHYRLSDEEYGRFRGMSVLICGDCGEMIPPPQKCQLLKSTNARSLTITVTTKSGHRISVPPDSSQNMILPSFASRAVDYCRLCWDAITPSQDQLITKHPDARLSNLYFAVGGSFHSWKFLPTIGKYVVNVLNGDSSGEGKDQQWAWKIAKPQKRGAHEKVVPRRELKDLED
ncbi:FAD/NAD(P)-binding domain-containing protein [Amniculicola lignicola CBS 123094]|uniref:FAD/NAD(P)-binding domain-containing protein n=1 Tax=Amniculicola lignicola CBS 123094 TaxID=1392246 RepID=A0A6A5WSF8_9PLEO|nr:FAD/NAD(P)-binding domain-containing protein [Amniculicola lignicola CBS 123094]